MKVFKDIEWKMFIPTLVLFIGVCMGVVFYPEQAKVVVKALLNFATVKFGWAFLLLGFVNLIFLLWLSFSKYGQIKFGSADQKPEYSFMSWLSMNFCTGIGSGVLLWGCIEWSYFINTPPLGLEPGSQQAFEFSNAYQLLHWGPSAWALYALPAIAMCYSLYIKKAPTLRLSHPLKRVMGKSLDGVGGYVFDNFILFGMLAGRIPALVLGAAMVAEAITVLTGIPHDFKLELICVVLWVFIFGGSVFLGVDKGIKRLSDINLYFASALILIVFFSGPTIYILNNFTQSLGILGQNFIIMSLNTDWYSGSGFAQGWTAWYMCWWVLLGPAVGMWACRISKGRSIKEVALGLIVCGSLGCMLSMGVLGNYAIYLQTHGILDVVKNTAELGGPISAVRVLSTLPMHWLVLGLLIITSFIFQATSLDSQAYVTAQICEKDVQNKKDPSTWHRLFWAAAFGVIAIALMFLGGLNVLKSAMFIAAIPCLFIFLIMTVSLYLWVREDYKAKSVVLKTDGDKTEEKPTISSSSQVINNIS